MKNGAAKGLSCRGVVRARVWLCGEKRVFVREGML